MHRLIFPLILGLAGVAVLIGLGVWQVQRLDWKQTLLSQIEARIAADPVPLPAAPTEVDDEYLAVSLSGRPTGAELHVLSSGTAAGTGYRVVSAFETDAGRRILLDQGILALERKTEPPALEAMQVLGNIVWPDDKTGSTPPPDLAANIWFAREVGAMAATLDTEPLLVVMRAASQYDPRLTPVPVDTSGIRNDHREYAITWFLLALVWGTMSLFLIARTWRRKD